MVTKIIVVTKTMMINDIYNRISDNNNIENDSNNSSFYHNIADNSTDVMLTSIIIDLATIVLKYMTSYWYTLWGSHKKEY